MASPHHEVTMASEEWRKAESFRVNLYTMGKEQQ